MNKKYLLTQYSHGAGCGCKISPQQLSEILSPFLPKFHDSRLLIGNDTRDDAAVFDMGDGTAIISTTDFFMPIVDDAYEFGCIASANAISDVYAMGGTPFLAIAILGWPLDKLPTSLASEVMRGALDTCHKAGVNLAGGHSIDSPEPIFGLAVTGRVNIEQIKSNGGAKAGDILLLTKGLGVGILTTAEKKGILKEEDKTVAATSMKKLNHIGAFLSGVAGVHAMTDVTGFGLGGHLTEMMEASKTTAEIYLDQLPFLVDHLASYIEKRSTPGGTRRNWNSYKDQVWLQTHEDSIYVESIIADPQTSGGLLIAVDPEMIGEVQEIFTQNTHEYHLIGSVLDSQHEKYRIIIKSNRSQ